MHAKSTYHTGISGTSYITSKNVIDGSHDLDCLLTNA